MTKPSLSIILPTSLLDDVVYSFESLFSLKDAITLFELDGSHYYGARRADQPADCQETLQVDGEVIGRVALYTDKEDVLLPRALQHLGLTLSIMATEAWRRNLLADEVLDRYDELNLIYGLGTSFVQGIPQDEIVRNVLEETNRIIQADAGVIYVVENTDDESIKIKPISYFGEKSTPDFWSGRVHELALSTLYAYEQAQLFDADRMICAPLRYNDEKLGALVLLYEREDSQFKANEVNLLTTLTQNTALFIYAVRLVDKLAHEKVQLESTLKELQATRDKLSQAERLSLIGQAVGSVVHDIRKPMGTVRLLAEELAHPANDLDARNYMVGQIIRYVDLVSDIAQEILEYVRGTEKVDLKPREIEAYLNEVAELLMPRGIERSVSLVLNTEKARGSKANIDYNRMMRVFQNLVNNAVDVLEAHGGSKVEIAAEPVGDLIRFTVSDDGPGVPPEIIDTLFEPFVTMGKSHGTGLGLAIVARIVAAHSGKIHYEAGPNGGASFIITVPQWKAEALS